MISEERVKYLKQFYEPWNKNIKFSDVLAICDKESSGIEYFTSNDKLFWQNIKAAEKITGLPRKEILDMVFIAQPITTKFQKFMFNAFHLNTAPSKYIKFRCEPSIYKLVKDMKEFTLKDKFLLASSVGVGQRLLYYWLANSKKPKAIWIKESKKFAVDIKAQMKEIVVNMSWWMLSAKGNRQLGFTRYNAGGGAKQPSQYGITVDKLSEYYRKYD